MSKSTPRIVVVTGSASGIGLATVADFLSKGDVVIGIDRDSQPEPLAGKHKGEWFSERVDVSRAHDVGEAFDRIISEYGRIDVLVTSAAVGFPEPFSSMTTESWDRVFQINVTGTMLCIRKGIDGMLPHGAGSIAVVSSIAGRTKSVTNGAHYTASKYGLIGLTRHLAAELAGTGIRINCIAPGPTNSPILTANTAPEQLDKIIANTPLGRIAEPEDVSEVISFVTSPQARQIHGAVLDVNGGLY